MGIKAGTYKTETLLSSHAKFKAAADMLQWAMNTGSYEVVDRAEVMEMVRKINKWSGQCFDAAHEKERRP